MTTTAWIYGIAGAALGGIDFYRESPTADVLAPMEVRP